MHGKVLVSQLEQVITTRLVFVLHAEYAGQICGTLNVDAVPFGIRDQVAVRETLHAGTAEHFRGTPPEPNDVMATMLADGGGRSGARLVKMKKSPRLRL